MKFIILILGIIQITLAQNPPVHEISQQHARGLQDAFVKLFSDGSIINDFAVRLEQRNGLDDQTINNIAKVVVREISNYITSIATTSPNSQHFISSVVSVIQEFDVLQELLNKEGFSDESIFAYILVGVYNDVLVSLKTMAEPFVQSIRFLEGNDIPLPKPTIKPDADTMAKFRASLTKIHQSVVEMSAHFDSSKLIGENGANAAATIMQKLNGLIDNILSTLEPTVAVKVKSMINDIFAQIATIMDVYEEYKGIDETQIAMIIIKSAYKSALSSFYKLELEAEKLSNSAPPAPPAHEHNHPVHNGIPPPPPNNGEFPEHSFVHHVEGAAPPHLEVHEPEPPMHVNPPSIPVGVHPVDQGNQRIHQLKQKTDRDLEALISLLKALKERSGNNNSMYSSIVSQTLQQFKNLAHSLFASQPAINAQITQLFEAIFADLTEWDKILKEGNHSIEGLLAELAPKILHDIFNYFYAVNMHNGHP